MGPYSADPSYEVIRVLRAMRDAMKVSIVRSFCGVIGYLLDKKDTGCFQNIVDLCFAVIYNNIVRDWKQPPCLNYVLKRNRHNEMWRFFIALLLVLLNRLPFVPAACRRRTIVSVSSKNFVCTFD